MSILVVDDERPVREALERALRVEGYGVDLAADGGEALSRVALVPPDAIVLDLLMPDVDGLEVSRRLRATGDRTPILILTARDAVSDRVAGLDAGADDYLVKPFALEELLARLSPESDPTPSETDMSGSDPALSRRDRAERARARRIRRGARTAGTSGARAAGRGSSAGASSAARR